MNTKEIISTFLISTLFGIVVVVFIWQPLGVNGVKLDLESRKTIEMKSCYAQYSAVRRMPK